MHFVFDVDKEKIAEAWQEGLHDNTPNASAEVKTAFKTLESWMEDMDKGQRITLTYVPGTGYRQFTNANLSATQKALASPAAAALSAEDRGKIESTVVALKESVVGDDYKLIRKRIDELNHATEQLAELVMNSAVSNALEGRKIAEV